MTGLLCFLLLLSGSGCRPENGPVIPEDAVTVMSYDLGQFGLADRDGDGQRNDPRPDAERAALREVVLAVRPDILVVQEMGNPELFNAFRAALKDEGLDYPHAELLQRDYAENNLALLSRYPLSACIKHTNACYTMGREQVPVQRGFLEATVEVSPSYRLRLLAAHLKSKTFHPSGQTEMRRNEARLLNNRVRAILAEDPDANLLVLGVLNDQPDSAAVKTVLGNELRDLRPADEDGEVWTSFEAGEDTYSRTDYLMVSDGLWGGTITQACRVVKHPAHPYASPHRPLLGVFQRTEGPN